MHPLALAAEMYGDLHVEITHEERARMRRTCRFPGDMDSNRDPRFYVRRPVIDVKQWRIDHAEKLRGMLAAEGAG